MGNKIQKSICNFVKKNLMEKLVLKVENYVISLLNEKLPASFLYHNIFHTQRVVEKTKILIEELKIDAKDATNLLLSAWFHDTGYIFSIENHEEESVQIASDFLKKQAVSAELILEVSRLILATKIGAIATDELQKIMKDADCAHLGSKNFSNYTSLLRKEWELTKNEVVSDDVWNAGNIEFLSKFRFQTTFAIKNWGKIAHKNLAELLIYQQKTAHKKVQKAPERGVETMFRVALRNHITLSDIADTKANILLSVNAIIISMTLSTLIPKLDNPTNHYLIIPSLIFVLFTVASIILSIMATRPNVTQGKFTKEDVANKKVNLLFFGNFHQMNLPDFEWAMQEMMQDRDYLYGSLTKDLYFLGLVLNRKYKLLRVTYTVFMIGIIVSVLAFAVAFKIQDMASIL